MPKDHSTPINEADRQARAAFKAYNRWLLRQDPVSDLWQGIDPRTYQRIAAGKRDVPPGLAREIAAKLRELMAKPNWLLDFDEWAAAFEAWADDCQQRSAARPQAAKR